MSKFELMWATGNEQCVNCAELIKDGEPYLRLIQNRWAKPAICQGCIKNSLLNIERMKRGEEKIEPDKKIIYESPKSTQIGWGGAY